MQRREFITLLGSAAATWPLAARAQQPDECGVIGFLTPLADRIRKQAVCAHSAQGLERGWIEGRNV